MKNIIKILSLCLLTLFMACDNDSNNLPEDFPDSGWLEISSNAPALSQVINGSTGVASVPFRCAIGTNEKGQTITYSVELINGSVDGLNLGTFNVNLEKNKKSSVIDIPLVYGDYEIRVSLLDTSNSEYTIGLSDGSKKVSHNITVTCGFDIKSSYTASPTAFGFSAPQYTANLTATSNVNEYTIDSSWGPNFVGWATGNSANNGRFLYSGTLLINCDNSVTITGDDGWATGGTGIYNPDNGEISYTLTQGLFSNPFQVEVTLTPQ